jgi:Na+/H+ antiporter NhaD/arsenite permease-like protein
METIQTTTQPWLIAPFCLLLTMIATGPLLYEKFWHKNYPRISVFMASAMAAYYIFVMRDFSHPLGALMEYIQFIALITALYVASGGIYIEVQTQAKPLVNLIFLIIGAVLANFIGTTGASMLLIRPYIRLNKESIKSYHIVFFIFMVSNVGGALTPIGDPPLFLGFMHGVPFFWTIYTNFLAWITAITLLSCMFYILDYRNSKSIIASKETTTYCKCKLSLAGSKNFLWLALIIATVFLDPNIFHWVPSLKLAHHEFSFIREIMLLAMAYVIYKSQNKVAVAKNQFDLGPLKEVLILFIGIFFTMIPAIQIICNYAGSESGRALINCSTLYWGTGSLSSVLDNAPTYLNFLAASMGSKGMDIANLSDVRAFAAGDVCIDSIRQLKAISLGAVFFGAMTYIGNGPNLMVKSIADQYGIKMPSFFGYIFKYSLVYLLPIFFIIWLFYI